jgi:uncharacterized protein YjbI with pentapeptide repeats
MDAAGRDLWGCEFVSQDLSGAKFDGCNLYHVRIEQCDLKDASFRGAQFPGSYVEVNSGDKNADFTDAIVNGVWTGGADGFDSYGLDPAIYSCAFALALRFFRDSASTRAVDT